MRWRQLSRKLLADPQQQSSTLFLTEQEHLQNQLVLMEISTLIRAAFSFQDRKQKVSGRLPEVCKALTG
jgi:hypothetical protein